MKQLFNSTEFDFAKSTTLFKLECKQCKKEFFLSKNYILTIFRGNSTKTGDFCSNKCQNDFQTPPTFINCSQCGKLARKHPTDIKKVKHNFCSKSCAAKYNNAHKTKGTRCSKLEKWLAEQLVLTYPKLDFSFNRKDTINSELDVYIPSIKLAFELNGIFHYEPIYGSDKLLSIQTNDNRKIQACLEKGIELCILDVSSIKYFKPAKCQKFLDIIIGIINTKL